ncbi:MAG: alpha/beta fold hydrolase [Bradymonadia bacterium]
MKCLCVPGLACSSDIFEAAAEHLPGLSVHAVDWPLPERITTMDATAFWVAEQIEATGAEVVIGHSLGGLAALHLYAIAPERMTARLFIADTFLAGPHPMFRNFLWQPPQPLEARVHQMLDTLRPKFPVLREAVMGFEETPTWREAALKSGAIFIYGGRGGEVSDDELARRAGIPEGATNTVHVVPGTSHFLMLEAPEAFYGHIREAVQASDQGVEGG